MVNKVVYIYTGARKQPKVRHRALSSPRHPRGHGMVSSTAARHLQHTAHASQCIFNGEWLSSFPVLSMVTLTFELWPWHSNSSERRTKHVAASSVWIWRKSVQRFPICLRHKQTKKSQTALKTEPYLRALKYEANKDEEQCQPCQASPCVTSMPVSQSSCWLIMIPCCWQWCAH